MEAFGIAPPLTRGGREGLEQEEEPLLIYPENWQSLMVFLALNRCWRVDSVNGHYLCLDRPAIETTLRLMRVKRKRHLPIFEDLQVMENAALEILNCREYGVARMESGTV